MGESEQVPLDIAAQLEFLATLTVASDCGSASTLALRRVAAAAEASEGLLMLHDHDRDMLVVRAALGPDPGQSLAMADVAHPFVDAARSARVVRSGDWIALPLPHAGVLVIGGGSPSPERLAYIARLSELAAPVLARLADAERYRHESGQLQAVERANMLKSEFLASMSHELRTPINAVLGHTANLIDGIYGDVAPAQDEMLKRIRAAAHHLLALINDILDLARIEAGKMPLRVETVHLRAVIIELAQQVEPMVRTKGLTYSSVVSEDCGPIVTDRTKLKQVLLNLLSNAIKFTQRGGITVRVSPAGSAGVRISVTDTGVGIRPRDLEVIWEDFRQVDPVFVREHSGTGLGLSITRKLLQRLGGSVALESEYGRGTTFTVTLPVQIALDDVPIAEAKGGGAEATQSPR
jgi:signal transduction histidine kinase